MSVLFTTVIPAVRVAVRGSSSYREASNTAYAQACEALGRDDLNLADATVALADGALLFTYTVIGAETGATR